MQKKFVANLAFLLGLNFIIKPFWILGIDREVQNILGAEAYGEYFALMNFSFLLNILLDVGLTNYNNRNISQHQFLVNKHFSSLFSLKLVLGVAYFVVAALVGVLLGYQEDTWMLLGLLLLNQFFVYLILYIRSNLAGLQLFKTDSVVSVLDRFLMIIFCGALILGNDTYNWLNIKTFALAQTVAYAIVAVIATLLVFKKIGRVKFNFNLQFSRIILKKSLPYAVLVLLMTFYNRTDSVMLERLLPDGAEQAGIYAQGYRLLDSANMIAFLFSTLLLPMFSNMLKKKEDVLPLIETAFKILITGVILMAVMCSFFAEPLMALLYTDEVLTSGKVFSILILNLIPISLTYIFGTLLTANGSLKWLNIMAVFGVLINIGINFAIIPYQKAFGTAISSLITQSLTAVTQIILSYKILKLKINWTLLAKTITFTVGCIAFCVLALNIRQDVLVWYKFVLVGAGSLLLASAFGLLSPKAALKLLKSK